MINHNTSIHIKHTTINNIHYTNAHHHHNNNDNHHHHIIAIMSMIVTISC